MAIFEPTEAEKAAKSYLDWDDAELGKFCKYVALRFRDMQKDAEGLHKVTATSCAMMLIGACVESNAAELTLDTKGFTHKGQPNGDWNITVTKVGG